MTAEPLLYRAAQQVYCLLTDKAERARIWPLVDRLQAQDTPTDPVKAHRAQVRVAAWAVLGVLGLIPDKDRREVAQWAVTVAEDSLRGEATQDACRAVATVAYNDAATDTAYASFAAAALADAAANTGIVATDAAIASVTAVAAARSLAGLDLVVWLAELLDQWETACVS